jgi:hypothetical protein
MYVFLNPEIENIPKTNLSPYSHHFPQTTMIFLEKSLEMVNLPIKIPFINLFIMKNRTLQLFYRKNEL